MIVINTLWIGFTAIIAVTLHQRPLAAIAAFVLIGSRSVAPKRSSLLPDRDRLGRVPCHSRSGDSGIFFKNQRSDRAVRFIQLVKRLPCIVAMGNHHSALP